MYMKQDKSISKAWKVNFFNYFLGQQKQKQVVVLVQENIENKYKESFFRLFQDTNHIHLTFSSKEELENCFFYSKNHFFVILINENLMIKDIKNDQRLFIFQTLPNQYKLCVINPCEEVIFNKKVDDFYLSSSFVKYLHLTDKLYLNISSIHGFGMFAKKNIPAGEILFKLSGELYTKEFLKDQNFHGEWNALENGKFLVRKNRTSYGFINHSRKPNCFIGDDMRIRSYTSIQKGEEILLDYRKEALPEDYVQGFGKTYL